MTETTWTDPRARRAGQRAGGAAGTGAAGKARGGTGEVTDTDDTDADTGSDPADGTATTEATDTTDATDTTGAGGGSTPDDHGGFRHEAVLYDGAEGLVQSLAHWMREGVAAGEPVVALVTARSGDVLRDALGADAERVQFADMSEAGRNPARIISVWRSLAAEHRRPGRRLRAIGEPVWPGRGPEELVECHHHEALLNQAFADADDLWLLCPYDVGALGPEALATVGHSHPVVVDGGDRHTGEYRGVPDAADVLGDPLPAPPQPVEEQPVEPTTLRQVRDAVRARATAAGLRPRRVRDLVLAVSEVATNSILHGGGRGTLRSWSTPTTLVHEVTDRGHIRDALVGRHKPRADQPDGRGLWLVNELCDLVQLRSSPAGTTVRLHMHTS